MKFQINQEVIVIATGKRAKIVATKKEPWNPKSDPYNRKEILPDLEKDYIILLYKGVDVGRGIENWEGSYTIYEHEITEYL